MECVRLFDASGLIIIMLADDAEVRVIFVVVCCCCCCCCFISGSFENLFRFDGKLAEFIFVLLLLLLLRVDDRFRVERVALAPRPLTLLLLLFPTVPSGVVAVVVADVVSLMGAGYRMESVIGNCLN